MNLLFYNSYYTYGYNKKKIHKNNMNAILLSYLYILNR